MPFCSNFFFMSLTLARAVGGTALPVTDRNRVVGSLPVPAGVLVNLSSTGLEAERWGVLVAVRLAARGGLAGVPFPFPLVDVDRAGGV